MQKMLCVSNNSKKQQRRRQTHLNQCKYLYVYFISRKEIKKKKTKQKEFVEYQLPLCRQRLVMLDSAFRTPYFDLICDSGC